MSEPARTAADTDWIARGDRHNSTTYSPSIVMERGEGVRVWDTDGNEYLDFLAGIAVCSLGHAHPTLTAALVDQVETLLHVSNSFYTPQQIELLERLTTKSFADRVFLCNSGTEANEAAMKLTRRFQKVVRGDEDRVEIVSMKKSFHGRTLASITATGQPKYHKGFEPLPAGYLYADFNDLDSVAALVTDKTAGIIVEPIQGEGGVRPAEGVFLEGLRRLCDDSGALLIFDEVQTGVGRTGTLWAYEGYGVVPDIMTLAKGLGGGVPVGAMISTDAVFEGFTRGSHATTFGGNPLASRAATTVLDVIDRDGLLANADERGRQLRAGLQTIVNEHDALLEVRGRGLMVGVECEGDLSGAIAKACHERGLLVNTAGGIAVRLVPPLVVTQSDVDEALEKFAAAVRDVA